MTTTTDHAEIDWDSPARTAPADCMPWCHSRATGHWPAGHPAECSTEGEQMMLPLGPPVEADEGEDPTDFLHTYLWSNDEQGVTVNVSHQDLTGLVMTTTEARVLAATLVRLADLAER